MVCLLLWLALLPGSLSIYILAHSHTLYNYIYFTFTYLTVRSHHFLQFQPTSQGLFWCPCFHIYNSFLWQLRNLVSYNPNILTYLSNSLYMANFLTRTGLPPCSVALLTWALTSAKYLLCTAMPNGFLTELLRQGRRKGEEEGETHYIWCRDPPLFYIPLCATPNLEKHKRMRKERMWTGLILGVYKLNSRGHFWKLKAK